MKKINLQGTQDYAVTTTDGDIELTAGGAGKAVKIDGLSYPDTDGSNGQVLTTDGAGSLTFQSAGGGSSVAYSNDPFAPVLSQRFAKTKAYPIAGSDQDRAFIPTTAHCNANDTIINVYNTGTSSTNTLTLFRVNKLERSRTVLETNTTSITGGTCVWVDISSDGTRAACAVKTTTTDVVIILSTSDDWATHVVEQTVTVAQHNDESIVSVALNADGSAFVASTGNPTSNVSVAPRVARYTRSVTTWSFDADVFVATVGNTDNIMLMYNQTDDTTVGFHKYANGSTDTSSLHLWELSGTWSEIWTVASIARGRAGVGHSCISHDGDTIAYRTGGAGASMLVAAKTTQTVITPPEDTTIDSPAVMTGDGHNYMVCSSSDVSSGHIWAMHRDGTALDEIAFQTPAINWNATKSYGNPLIETLMRPSKGDDHHYIHATVFLPYTTDAIISCIDNADWVNPGSGIKY